METLRMDILINAAHECAAAAHGASAAPSSNAPPACSTSLPQRTHALVAKTARSLA